MNSFKEQLAELIEVEAITDQHAKRHGVLNADNLATQIIDLIEALPALKEVKIAKDQTHDNIREVLSSLNTFRDKVMKVIWGNHWDHALNMSLTIEHKEAYELADKIIEAFLALPAMQSEWEEDISGDPLITAEIRNKLRLEIKEQISGGE